MNVLVLLAHPNPKSFNHAIAATVLDALRANGHAAWFHDLQAEEFDPVMTAAELNRDAQLPPLVQLHLDQAVQADGIIVVHPNWWSAPPAILRGWVDRVLRAGKAYNFEPDGKGGARPVGLLRARHGLVFNTANTPQDKEEALFGDPLQTHWLKVVFDLCGVKRVDRRNFSPIITSTPGQRDAWLAETQAVVRECFPSMREGPQAHGA